MTKLRKLKLGARLGALHRGHSLGRFRTLDGRIARATCRECGRDIVVNCSPSPNEIDIGGGAIGFFCLHAPNQGSNLSDV